MNRSLYETTPSTSQVVAQVALGVAAGLVASWLTSRVSRALQRRRATSFQDERTPYQGKIHGYNGQYSSFGQEPTQTSRPGLTGYLPAALGTTAGAGYGTWYAMQPGSDVKRALLYGVGLGLVTHRGLRLVGRPASRLIRRRRY